MEIPRGLLTVVTGVSGSGKSSLVHDTIFAMGQRRYLECLSPKTRSSLRQLDPPDVDAIEGLPPTLSVPQTPGAIRTRSTVATLSEIHDYLRLLYARCGIPHCSDCGIPIEQRSPQEICDQILAWENGRKVMLLAPVVRGQTGGHAEVLAQAAKQGFVRARVDGELQDLSAPLKLAKNKRHTIEVIVDRVIIKEGLRSRLDESIALAVKLGGGACIVAAQSGESWEDHLYSTRYVCPQCGKSLSEIEPRTFSFNSPYGACPTCQGLGEVPSDPESDVPTTCPDCQGTRLQPAGRSVTLTGLSLPTLLATNLNAAEHSLQLWNQATLKGELPAGFREGSLPVAARILPDLLKLLGYLTRIGLGYLTLDRAAPTLSGGELQRVRLATMLGKGLARACYLLDEPTAGLHPIDGERLIKILRELRDKGNTLIVVEHDIAMMQAADYLLEIGPGAGPEGGRLVAAGTLPEFITDSGTVSGPYLQAAKRTLSSTPRAMEGVEWLHLEHVHCHNLQDVSVKIPLQRFICLTGVSGSGKTSLMRGGLLPTLKSRLWRAPLEPGCRAELSGGESIQRLQEVDQRPLGRNSRSNPATATGIWNHVRKLLSVTRDAKVKGFSARRFSTQSPEGRCATCRGLGFHRLSMGVLPELQVPCPACHGGGFNPETLSIRYKGLNAGEILQLSIREATQFFENIASIHSILKVLDQVGLGYLRLGQSATTLSGGESQRVKLASALVGDLQPATLFFLDEPSTGLHPADLGRLIDLLQKLVDQGHTVIVIEHQLEMIAAADWVIDLGPGAGPEGGKVVAACSPRVLLKTGEGVTAEAFRGWFEGGK
ncbi:MAG: excinuclease ABC subunit UvrA [Planctomycetales bacterium]